MVDYIQADEVQDRSYDSTLMRRILKYMRPYRGTVAFSVVLLALVSIFQLAPPYLTKVAIDRYLTPAGDISVAARYTGLWKILALFAIALFAGFITSYVQIYTMSWVGQRVMFDLRVQIFRQIQRMDVAFFDKNPVGRLMTRLTSDVEVLNELFTSGVV
ncbi:MAG: ABC transporter transmembrane domain-containing protein, partial [Candidatus Latescibacterota bacterium]